MITLTLPAWSLIAVVLLGTVLLALQTWRILLLLESNMQRKELQAFAQTWRAWQRSRKAYDETLRESAISSSSGFQPRRQAYWRPESVDTTPG